jgi:NAD(P)-dependent dehydrogenase (short-subunit alcohol dehydrogenase family)
MPFVLDVNDTTQIAPCLEQAEAAFGAPVDVLLNNAGMSIDGRLLDVSPDDYDGVMSTNTRAPFFIAQAVARRLVATEREGSIINIASLIVMRPNTGIGVYGMSKAAVDFMTRTMAKEWSRHGIRVNALLPGYIETEMNTAFFQSEAGARFLKLMPRRRIGKLTDLDGPTLLLASGASSGMNGASIVVDDGQLHGKF